MKHQFIILILVILLVIFLMNKTVKIMKDRGKYKEKNACTSLCSSSTIM
jgi:hypothetical protein